MKKKHGQKKLVPQDFSCRVELVETQDEESEEDELIILNKIGGKPIFIQGDEYPTSDKWELLIQLDSMNVPFYINFGDAGVGYGFINQDRTKAKFLWQCA